jgi:uncharacterized membrane-anchored protein YjiN (DUF445 family)
MPLSIRVLKKIKEMKQTSIEWLVQELRKYGSPIPRQLEEQAKEMEKQQIIDARVKKPLDSEYKEAEQYYNEKYNK